MCRWHISTRNSLVKLEELTHDDVATSDEVKGSAKYYDGLLGFPLSRRRN
jgi:hypothetical protein